MGDNSLQLPNYKHINYLPTYPPITNPNIPILPIYNLHTYMLMGFV
jgi:hypothetical protein